MEVVVMIGCWWQPGRSWGLGSPPLPLPSRSSLVASICTSEDTSGLGIQLGRLGGLRCPPMCHLGMSIVSPMDFASVVAGGGAWVSLGGHEALAIPPPPPLAPLRWLLATTVKKDQQPSLPS
jgi:hypothetical protein